MITEEKVRRARREAERFLYTLRLLEIRAAAQPDCLWMFHGSKETSAAKRASMDLTRELAHFRQSGGDWNT